MNTLLANINNIESCIQYNHNYLILLNNNNFYYIKKMFYNKDGITYNYHLMLYDEKIISGHENYIRINLPDEIIEIDEVSLKSFISMIKEINLVKHNK